MKKVEPWIWLPPIVGLLLLGGLSLAGLNEAVFFDLNHLGGLLGDSGWARLNILGDTLVAAALLLCWAERRPDIVWAAVLAGISAGFWASLLKEIEGAPRPPAVLPPEQLHIIGRALYADSFPSGHATTAFTLAGVLVLFAKRAGVRWLFFLLAVSISLSRSVAGVHWPVDLVSGMLVGWSSAVLGVIASRHWRFGVTFPGRQMIALLLCICTLYLLFIHDTGFRQADLFQRVIAISSLGWWGWGIFRSGISANPREQGTPGA